MGITVYLYDYPFTGERTITELPDNSKPFDVFEYTCSVLRSQNELNERLINLFIERLYRDVYYMRCFGARYHGFTSKNIALIGVGTGCLLSGNLYNKFGIGEKLCCIGGHLDFSRFAQTFFSNVLPGLSAIPMDHIVYFIIT